MTTVPMAPATIRRLMTTPLPAGVLEAAERDERRALAAWGRFVALGSLELIRREQAR